MELPGGEALLFTFPRMKGCDDDRCEDDRFSFADLPVRRCRRRRGAQQPINPKTPSRPLSKWCLLRSKGIFPTMRNSASNSLIPRMMVKARYIKPRTTRIAAATQLPAAFPTATYKFCSQRRCQIEILEM